LRANTKRKSNAEPVVIKAELLRARFRNEDTGFTIATFEAKTNNDPDLFSNSSFTAKGPLPSVRPGDIYRLTGHWANDPKWGRQFVIDEANVLNPDTADGAVRYLVNIASGIGPVTANKIVEALGGGSAIQTLIDTPDRLMALPFLKEAQKQEILNHLNNNQILAKLCSLICRDGIGPATANRIFEQYGKDSVNVVKENPYVLCDDVAGIGFKKADLVAVSIGIEWDSPYRIQAAYRYMLQLAADDGDCYLTPNATLARMSELLGKEVPIALIAQACANLEAQKSIVREGADRSMIYLKAMSDAEKELANNIASHMNRPSAFSCTDERSILEWVKAHTDFELAELQETAMLAALRHPISIITGGPGTGKSTVLKAICDVWAKSRPADSIYLAAPTGKASKRMEEATGRESKTVHRLLGYNPEMGFMVEKLSGLLIVDEFSMMDLELARALSVAFDDGLNVVLVGDVDQLPSVGPGKVLSDIIQSGIPTTRLRFNYRQAAGSKIATYAALVNAGEIPPYPAIENDFVCMSASTSEDALPLIERQVDIALAEGIDPYDIQILCPMRKNSLGTKNLNDVLRKKLNRAADPDDVTIPRWKVGDTVFFLGDKVIQTKNNYDLGVFNGDTGKIIDFTNATITLDFDGWSIDYDRDQAMDLQLAYALTIHKSQGSEFPVVIMPIMSQAWIMLQRTLLYTGMTRAKKRLVLITNDKSLKQAVKNVSQHNRNTYLKERIIKALSAG
jgi:exodeoxyribonuclease V alpha subunit